MSRQKIWVALALVLVGSPRIAHAQIAQAMVVGRVQDPSGSVMPSVEVQMKRLSTNEVFRTVTTETGDYTLSNLPVGTYEIRVAAAGFRTEIRTGVTLEVGRTYRFDFALAISQVAERMEVTAETPLLTTEKPEVATVIDNTKIVELPLPLALPRKEKPGLVLAIENTGEVNGTSYRRPVLVLLKWGARPAIKEIPGIQFVVAKKVEKGAMQRIRAALGHHADDAPRPVSVLGSIKPGFDLELLRRVRSLDIGHCTVVL